MKKQLITLSLGLLTTATFGQTTWNADKSHSKITFSATHMVISETEGEFKDYAGSISTKDGSFENADIKFDIDINSITTDNDQRDGHLKSGDFFNAEKYPKMKFTSTSFKQVKGKNWELLGNLTIKDITKPITLDVKYNGTIKDPYGNTRAGFKIKGDLNRFDYDLKWSSALETGGLVVGEEVGIEINLELIQAK
ncbi:MAG: polyisoprenoid-binding protein YceI [Sphingobacteriales bacterium]|jgi:polyisoprenoid-binding protein YceI